MEYLIKHGLVDNDHKLTLTGKVLLEAILRSKESDNMQDDDAGEFNPKYCVCYDLEGKTIKQWEEENHSIFIGGSNEGCIEVQPIKFFCEDTGVRVWDKEERLSISMMDDMSENEARITLWTKKDAIELRDYLTKFIEKEEDWYKVPQNI